MTSTSLACEFLKGKDAPLCVCILCALNSLWYKVDAYSMFMKPHAVPIQQSSFCLPGAPKWLQDEHNSSQVGLVLAGSSVLGLHVVLGALLWVPILGVKSQLLITTCKTLPAPYMT